MLSFVDEVVLSCNTDILYRWAVFTLLDGHWTGHEEVKGLLERPVEFLIEWIVLLIRRRPTTMRKKEEKTVESQVYVIVRVFMSRATKRRQIKKEKKWKTREMMMMMVIPYMLRMAIETHAHCFSVIRFILKWKSSGKYLFSSSSLLHDDVSMRVGLWLTYVFQLHRIIKNQRCED